MLKDEATVSAYSLLDYLGSFEESHAERKAFYYHDFM